MTPAARLSAAIELVETIDAQRVPAAKALKEWGTAHRYAGSGDRAAMGRRAAVELGVNTLKGRREKILSSLAHLGGQPTPWSPTGLRIELGADARNPGIHAEEDFIKGAIEVQDEGSQLAALLSAAKPGEQGIDLCAGAGGKTLAPAAMMQRKGRLI